MADDLKNVSEEILEDTFIKGMKLDLQTLIKTRQPMGLKQAIKLALVFAIRN